MEKWITVGSPARDDGATCSVEGSELRLFIIPRKSSMTELEEVVVKLLDDPATEPIASEIGGAPGLSHLCSMNNHLGKFYSPSTEMML